MAGILNQDLGFDDVRWATMRKTSYDSGASFHGPARPFIPEPASSGWPVSGATFRIK